MLTSDSSLLFKYFEMSHQISKALLMNLAKYSEVTSFAKKIFSDGYAERLQKIYEEIICSQLSEITIQKNQLQQIFQILKDNISIITNEIRYFIISINYS